MRGVKTMNNRLNIVSYTLAALSGISFICGLVILSDEGGE